MWKIFQNFGNLILEAVFPLSQIDLELQNLFPEKALQILPISPPSPINSADAIWAYKDPRVRRLIWSIKYKKSAHCADLAAYALVHNLLQEMKTSEKYIIVPMPITSQRRKERGFNQVELILSRPAFEIPQSNWHINTNLLIRTQNKKRQTFKSRAERLASAKGVFAVDAKKFESNPDLLNSTIILIDDVITTGSTMQEGIDTLKRAGFKNVRGLSIAH